MTDKIAFNVNDTVRVRLTDEGRAYHRQRHTERYPMLEYTPPEEDGDGWSRWQLWALMQEFGEGIHLGGKAPFETGIELVSSDALATAIRSLKSQDEPVKSGKIA